METARYTEYFNPKKEIQIKDLKLGDQVDLGDYPFSTATVVLIAEKEIHLIRPFVHIENFSYSSGRVENGSQVLNYLGHETVRLWPGDTRAVKLISRLPEGRIK